MNVLHFYKTSLPTTVGGVEVFIDSLCKSTKALGVRNTVFSLVDNRDTADREFNGYNCAFAKYNISIASTSFSLSAFHKFRDLAKSTDIIHYHFPNPFADMLDIIVDPKKPKVLTYHSDIVRQQYLYQFYKPLQKVFLDRVDKIIVTSPNYFKSSDTLKRYTDKTEVIPIGIDAKKIKKPNSRFRSKLTKKLGERFFLFVGALRYYKGLKMAIQAVKDTDIKLVIAGIGSQQKELELYCAVNGIENVLFLGFVSEEEKLCLFDLCYGFVFPSHLRSEAFGISLLEAAAHAKPLISCEIGTGTSFVNKHNETGFVIPPSDCNALKQAMLSLLDNSSLATSMGKSARGRALELFTLENQAASYYNVYSNLL